MEGGVSHVSRKIARGGPGRYSSCLTPLSPWLPCRSRSSRLERSTWTASAPLAPRPHRKRSSTALPDSRGNAHFKRQDTNVWIK